MSVVLQKGKYEVYWLDRILPQICTASAYLNMKHVLQHMQYGFAVIYETLSTNNKIVLKIKLEVLFSIDNSGHSDYVCACICWVYHQFHQYRFTKIKT